MREYADNADEDAELAKGICVSHFESYSVWKLEISQVAVKIK